MIINTPPNNLETSGTGHQTDFTIECNDQAFDILIKHLYSDIPGSIVRELSSNAFDSHIAAGNIDTPIIINFPNEISPVLMVKDFGTGLSPDDITNIYTRIFVSNRRGSNEFLGGRGLGSKVPFTYTDNFIVETRYNGTRYSYAAYRKENRVPTLSLMSQTTTDESNGVTITIPIKSSDFYKFHYAGQKQLSLLNVKTNIEIKPLIPILTTESKEGLYKRSDYKSPGAYVNIGNIIYPINIYNLSNTNDINPSYYTWDSVLLINAPIGTITITPNREELVYDSQTIEFLEHKLTSLRTSIMAQIYRMITQASTYIEACSKVMAYKEALTKLNWWNDNLFIHPSQPNKKLEDIIDLDLPKETDLNSKYTIYLLSRCKNFKEGLNTLPIRLNHIINIYYLSPSSKYKKYYVAAALEDCLESDAFFVLTDDINSLITFIKDHIPNACVNAIDTNTLYEHPTPEKKNRPPTKNLFMTVYNFTKSYPLPQQDFVYLLTDGTTIRAAKDTVQKYITTIYDFRDLFDTYPRTEIYILPPNKHSLAKNGKSLTEAVQEYIKGKVDSHKDLLYTNAVISTLPDPNLWESIKYDPLTNKGVLIDYLKQYTYKNSLHNIEYLANKYDIPLPTPDKTECEKLLKIYNTYEPLLASKISFADHPEILHAFELYVRNKK